MGKVVAGNWDQHVDCWQDLSMVQAFKQHFRDGLAWEDTEFRYLINGDFRHWNERWNNSRWLQLAESDELFSELASPVTLYSRIKSDGYRVTNVMHEVTVNVGRSGQLIFNNSGSHRLCIAQLLGIERIPIRVLIRHRDWTGSHPNIR